MIQQLLPIIYAWQFLESQLTASGITLGNPNLNVQSIDLFFKESSKHSVKKVTVDLTAINDDATLRTTLHGSLTNKKVYYIQGADNLQFTSADAAVIAVVDPDLNAVLADYLKQSGNGIKINYWGTTFATINNPKQNKIPQNIINKMRAKGINKVKTLKNTGTSGTDLESPEWKALHPAP